MQALPIGTVIEALWKAEAGWPMAMAEHRDAVASLTAALEQIEVGILRDTITTAQLRDQLTTASRSLFPIGPSDPTEVDAGRAELQRYIDQAHAALLGSRDLAADTELIDRGLSLITEQTQRLGSWGDTASPGNRYRATVVLGGVRQTCDLVHNLTARSGPIGDTTLLAALSGDAALTALGTALDEPNTEPVDPALLVAVREFGDRITAALETPRAAETATRAEPEIGYWLPQLAQSSTLRLSSEAVTDDQMTAKTAKTRARASGVPARAFHEAALDAARRASSPAELRHNLELWIRPAIEFYAADVRRKSHLTKDLLAASEPILRATPTLTPLIGTDAQNYHGLGQRLVRRLEAVEAEVAASPHRKSDAARTAALLTIRKGLRDQLGRVVTDFADGVCDTTTAFTPILDTKLKSALAKIAAPRGGNPDYSRVDPAHSRAIDRRFPRGRASMEMRRAINEGHLRAAVGILAELQDRAEHGSPRPVTAGRIVKGDYARYPDERLDTELIDSVAQLLTWYTRDLALRATSTTEELTELDDNLRQTLSEIPAQVRDDIAGGRRLTPEQMLNFRFQARNIWHQGLPERYQPHVTRAVADWDATDAEAGPGHQPLSSATDGRSPKRPPRAR
ncbi:MAG: hypothetical protein ACRD3Q_14300 [Terriglobales bacterium]